MFNFAVLTVGEVCRIVHEGVDLGRQGHLGVGCGGVVLLSVRHGRMRVHGAPSKILVDSIKATSQSRRGE